jgi:hypothetical protein
MTARGVSYTRDSSRKQRSEVLRTVKMTKRPKTGTGGSGGVVVVVL